MKYKIALAGNPNSGKTTVFNLLCGTKERIGNWAGTTVEQKKGYYSYEGAEIKVVDLPGTYSLSAYSIDEKIARDFLIKEKPDLVVTVIDASNLERNLYLVAQLLELAQPVLLDLNMIDIAKSRGMKIDIEKLSKVLKVDIVATVASKGKGIERLKVKIKENLDRATYEPFKINYGKYIESAIEQISDVLLKTGVDMGLPPRSMAVLLLEEDSEIIEKVQRFGVLDDIEKIEEEVSKEVLSHYHDDVESIIIEKRYGLLKGIKKECVNEELTLEDKLTISDKIDNVFTNRILGIPLFLFFMFLLFQLVFTIGNPFSNLIGDLFAWLGGSSKHLFVELDFPSWITSLISDGIIGGVGSVLVFLPNIVLLFLGISFLEDSGYLTRAAFVMDRFMHALGLHGKSFIPLLLGFGCNVPAIMSTRILESRKDRILTILVNPLMSCSARLTVYTLFAAAFFPRYQALVIFSLYLLGIVLAIIVARIFKGAFFKGEVAPLVMELPPYRMPTWRNLFGVMWFRSSLFVKKAGTVIFIAVVLVWALSSFPPGVSYASSNSLIGHMGKFIAPILKPAGFGFWQAGVALIFGTLAKEVVVGTLGTLFGAEGASLQHVLPHYFTPLSAYAFLIMILVYIPCVATIAAIKRETNWRWATLAVSYSLILGWSLGVVFYQVGSFFVH